MTHPRCHLTATVRARVLSIRARVMQWIAASCWAVATATVPACVASIPETVVVEHGELDIGVDVTGLLKPVDSLPVAPPSISGVWEVQIAMMAPEGDEVNVGDPIAGFDASHLQQELRKKVGERDAAVREFDVERARAKVVRHDDELAAAQAEADLRKAANKADVPASITSVIELEKARADEALAGEKVAYLQRKAQATRRRERATFDRLEGQRQRANERVEEIEHAIERLTVKASRNGTVIYETDWRGDKRKVGDSVWRGDTVMRVASLDNMAAAGEIDEADASHIAVGQAVRLRLDAQPDLDLRGTIRTIAQTVRRASPENPLKVVFVDIELHVPEGAKLRPGMRFRGRVETDRVADVLVVPLDAVQPTTTGPVVSRVHGSRIETVAVRLGRRDHEHVEIVEGLSVGDRVVATVDHERGE